ncbi:MAG: shikimate kinase [Leptospirales bacterium]|nr:shikimate kinase [Leptospirales bacterium]
MNHPQENIAFIGARGAGKSRLSRKLGKLCGRVTLSTDSLISYEAGGLTIAEIVAAEGWHGFRQREYQLLQKFLAMRRILIDCGGGILVESDARGGEVLSQRKLQLLRQTANIVYIKRNLEWLLERGQADALRPQLSADYEQTLMRRLPWYEEAADFTLNMDSRSLDEAMLVLQREFGLQAPGL